MKGNAITKFYVVGVEIYILSLHKQYYTVLLHGTTLSFACMEEKWLSLLPSLTIIKIVIIVMITTAVFSKHLLYVKH